MIFKFVLIVQMIAQSFMKTQAHYMNHQYNKGMFLMEASLHLYNTNILINLEVYEPTYPYWKQ